MAKYPTRQRIFDLVGEGQVNPDGTKRQAILRHCQPGQAVTLLREPDNQYDRNAVQAMIDGGAVGYLARVDAAAIAPELDQGRSYSACVHELTGGMPDYPSFGCRICITWDGQKELASKPIRPEQSRYGKAQSSGCALVLLLLLAPIALLIATHAAASR